MRVCDARARRVVHGSWSNKGMARRPIPIEPDSDDEVEFFLDVDKYLPLEIFESLALQIAKERDHAILALASAAQFQSLRGRGRPPLFNMLFAFGARASNQHLG